MTACKESISELLHDYLDGVLPSHKNDMVEAHLDSCEACRQELEALKTLFGAFQSEAMDVPSTRLRSSFEEALEQEKAGQGVVHIQAKKKSWTSDFLKIAAGIALLVTAFQSGRILQLEKSNQDVAALLEENLQNKQMAMLSLMENQSASKRIQGVSYIEDFPNPDEAIVRALANRLLTDDNDNVRLNAFEALAKFSSSPEVKTVFIEALGQEKNPSIQIGIIQALVKIQEKKAVIPMQKLLEKEDTQPFVKNEIEMALPKII
ncbi:HEAT repeat domain-containing protein [Flagellimonas flava]|uniref:Putative zinc-finger n=1 Tax=Flagellimonas flava TaxID=570519 RepID=A0A1M5MDA7_9FLAO|nr:HEAT repeat domain-containing protein [Allomuricauda flava]SHG75374.1 Putative zinc-finger [Allomuricauda flava]